MSSHTPEPREPWDVEHCGGNLWVIKTEAPNVDHFISCWRALAGIAHPEAVPQVIEAATAILFVLGPEGYLSPVGKTRTDALRAALAALDGAK